jgi:hypothetical protein
VDILSSEQVGNVIWYLISVEESIAPRRWTVAKTYGDFVRFEHELPAEDREASTRDELIPKLPGTGPFGFREAVGLRDDKKLEQLKKYIRYHAAQPNSEAAGGLLWEFLSADTMGKGGHSKPSAESAFACATPRLVLESSSHPGAEISPSGYESKVERSVPQVKYSPCTSSSSLCPSYGQDGDQTPTSPASVEQQPSRLVLHHLGSNVSAASTTADSAPPSTTAASCKKDQAFKAASFPAPAEAAPSIVDRMLNSLSCAAGILKCVGKADDERMENPPITMDEGFPASLRHNIGKLPKDKYTIDKDIVGKGAYGTVRKARRPSTLDEEKGSLIVVAVKTMRKGFMGRSAIVNEISIHSEMKHANVARLFETYEDKRDVHLVMEVCYGGDLFDAMDARAKHKEPFSECDSAAMMLHILRAVVYMHSLNIAHRDLKPENFTFAEKGGPIVNNVLKIIDFGLAKRFETCRKDDKVPMTMTTMVGTPYYMAPEVIGRSYTEKCDVWSCGVILYVLLSGVHPFAKRIDLDSGSNPDAHPAVMAPESDEELFKKTKEGRVSFDISEFEGASGAAKNLIEGLCKMPESARMTA